MKKRRLFTMEDVDQIIEEIPELSGQITLLHPHPEFVGNYSCVYRGILHGKVVGQHDLYLLGQ
jgi:hypothetical protein